MKPQPLHKLPLDQIKRVTALAFDIDDTVTEFGKLCPKAYTALFQLAEAGVLLVPVTGRPLGWGKVIVQQWPVAFAVTENGACWVYEKKGKLEVAYFDDEKTRAAHAAIRKNITANVERQLPIIQVVPDQSMRECDLAFDTSEQAKLSPEHKKTLDAIIEKHGAHVVRSSIHTHAALGTSHKAAGFAKALKHVLDRDIHKELEQWLFVGDSLNDASMFDMFPSSIGVQNIEPHLSHFRTPPTFITSESHGRGFAEVAHLLLRAKE